MLNHLPTMIRGPYKELAEKFNLEISPTVLLGRNDARRIIRDDATIHNYTASARYVEFWVRTTAEAAVDSTQFARISLKAYETVTIPRWVIKSGWILEAAADANSAVNLLLCYDEEATE